jgi:ribosomal protein S27E
MPDPYWENIGKEVEKNRAARDAARIGKLPSPAGRTGERMLRCADCGHKQYEHWTARVRRFRLHCPSCGSIRYEPYTKEAKDDIADMNDVRKSYGDKPGTGYGKFMIGH